jgi:ribonuclease HII
VLAAASRVAVRVICSSEIDRSGLHRSNLWGLRVVLDDVHRPDGACLVDGFRLGPLAPPHVAVVDGDTKSAAIAAASVVAKVTRDRLMRRLDAVYPRYGFSSHVGYITPGHTRAVLAHGPCPQHRRSFAARAYRAPLPA